MSDPKSVTTFPKTLDPALQAKLMKELGGLSLEQLKQVNEDAKRKRKQVLAERKLYSLYPDEGPLRRELYPKHVAFFAAGGRHEPMPWCPKECDGSGHQERALIAANRTGKTLGVCFELTCHMIGWYPDWWTGRRFDGPVSAWIAGEDAKSVRESLQDTLLGAKELKSAAIGTGTIPKANIVDITTRQGVSDSVDTIVVKTAWGGTSRCAAKTYDQGRESFQAAQVDVVAFDEEPPADIYSEGLTRTMSTVPGKPSGIVLCSFTPLRGLSDVVLSYFPGGKPMTQKAA